MQVTPEKTLTSVFSANDLKPWMTICSRRIRSPDAGASMDTTRGRKVQEKTPTGGGHPDRAALDEGEDQPQAPLRRQHFLYFFPDPHGHGPFRPPFAPAARRGWLGDAGRWVRWLPPHRCAGAGAGAARRSVVRSAPPMRTLKSCSRTTSFK